MKSLLYILVLLPVSLLSQGNSDKDEARKLAMEAIGLMDKGEIDKSIELLAKAQKLDPDDINYPYETAYAWYLKQNYKKANKILIGLINREDATSPVYQLLGNTYDMLKDSQKAMETYEKGLERFPNSGNLYLEIGVVHMANDKLNDALNSFERGIYLDPAFPSNYYWAARFYLGSTEEVWGMLYGEIFMNLERGSKRTAEMSKALYETYMSQIEIKGDSASISFSKNSTVSIGENGEMKMPFPIIAYEPTLMLSLIGVEELNLESLHKIRDNFVRIYHDGELKEKYPNILFDYQKQLRDLGYFESYNHWLLMKGNEEAFTRWREENETAFQEFLNWYRDNPLKVDERHSFHSSFY